MGLILTVTNAGRAALVNAANTGTAPVTIAQVGLTDIAVTPAATTTSLPGEFKRLATMSGDVVADDTIHVIVRDEGADVFTVRSLALYLDDGTLFAIYGQPDVLLEKSAQALMLLAIDVQFADVDATLLAFGDANFLNPPATTERQGVVELATVAEAQAGIDALRALTPAGAKAAIMAWLLSLDGAGSGLDADLLDGQHGSYYANIPARLGYTPINKGGDTVTAAISYQVPETSSIAARPNGNTPLVAMGNGIGGPAVMTFHRPGSYATFFGIDTDNQLKFGGWSAGAVANVIWHTGNDGAGSGLDADLLDGQQGGFYTNIPARLGYQPVQQGTGVGQLSNVVKIGWGSNSRVRVTVDSTDQGNIVFDANLAGGGLGVNGAYVARNGNHLFGPDNDGAGSGLDADLLDGLQSTQFMRNFTNNWVRSEEGRERFFFTPNADTYARVSGAFRWQNGSDANVGSIDESGNLWLSGQVDALRVVTRANGDGMAIKVGDDAWIGDVNWVNGIGIRGQQDSRAGFVTFGTSGLGLGCDAADATLRYAGNPVWHAGNDGAGSGLDADTVDGWQRDDIRHWNNLLGKPFNWAGQEGQPQWLWGSNDGGQYYVWNPSNFSVNYANSAGSSNSANYANSAGNADTVDGLHASDLMPTGNLSAAGYTRLPNGLILQWGTVSCSSNSYGSVTFPIIFPNACVNIQSCVATEVGNGDAQANCPLPYSTTRSGANFWNAAPAATAWWWAIGY
jgi:hypothetical protein